MPGFFRITSRRSDSVFLCLRRLYQCHSKPRPRLFPKKLHFVENMVIMVKAYFFSWSLANRLVSAGSVVKNKSLICSQQEQATCHISKTSVGEYEMRILEVSITLKAFLTYWEERRGEGKNYAFAFLTWLKCFWRLPTTYALNFHYLHFFKRRRGGLLIRWNENILKMQRRSQYCTKKHCEEKGHFHD